MTASGSRVKTRTARKACEQCGATFQPWSGGKARFCSRGSLRFGNARSTPDFTDAVIAVLDHRREIDEWAEAIG